MTQKKLYRPLDGILLLDKPQGLSSNAALQRCRWLFQAKKGGHTGSLDPLATGLLPLCFGEATKIAGWLLKSDKAYQADILLGTTTDTDDADGQILLERPVPPIDSQTLQNALKPLTGHITQRAPIYSALKQGGEPLYAKARRGETVQAPERQIHIQRINVLQHNNPHIRLEITCGSGTYIRSIARDLGEALGCGAHITALRRLWVAPFTTPKMWTLEQLQNIAEQQSLTALESCLLPIEQGLKSYQAIHLSQEHSTRFLMGQRLHNDTWPQADALVVYNPTGHAIGLAQVSAAHVLSALRILNRPLT